MASHCQRYLGFLTRLYRARYLSTFETRNQLNTLHNYTEELHILNELSTLLPISHKHNVSTKQIENRGVVADLCLSPEERLRGVFLQKLKGQSAIETALAKTDVHLSIDVVANVLNRGNLGGEAMVIFFNWVVKQSVIGKDIGSYNVLIRALGRRKYINFAMKILMDLKRQSVNVNLETFSIVVDCLIRAKRVCKAIEMFGNSEEFGFRHDTECLNVLLQCLCKRSHVGAANSYFISVKGKIPFSVTTYNIIIGGWSKFGRVGEMERIMEMMVEDGFDPDCSTFCFMLEGLGRAGRVGDAVKVFDTLKERNGVINIDVYNAMISAFLLHGDLDKSMKYYRCMMSDNCNPNIDTYGKLISSSIRARKVADALEMLDDMLVRGIVPTTGMTTSFIEPLCNFGPPYAAMMIYRKARKGGCKISFTAYKLLLMRLSRFGKCGMLLSIWDEMQESGYSSDMEVYEYIINGLCNIGQLQNAVLVMEESIRKGFCPGRLIYSKLNNKLLAAGRVERAYKLFLQIKKARCNENSRRFWRANGWHF